MGFTMIEANQASFRHEAVEASHVRLVLADFWAPWCAPCRVLGPLLERLERDAAGQFVLVKVNAEENPALAEAYGVRALPCVVAFRQGEAVDRFVGLLPATAIRNFIDRLAPRPGEALLARARQHAASGDLEAALRALDAALAEAPARADLRAERVRTLIRLGRDDEAGEAFAPLAGGAGNDLGLAALRLLLEARRNACGWPSEAPLRQAVDADAADDAARWRLAQWLMADERWPDAMETLVALAESDRTSGRDAGRRGLLAAFELCDDPALVATYRRRLAAGRAG
jgi:putative thioredoxin